MNFKRKLGLWFAAFGIFGSAGAAPLQSVELFTPGQDTDLLLFHHQRDNSLIRNVSIPDDGTVNRADAPEAKNVECFAYPGRAIPEFTKAIFRGRVFLPPDHPLRLYTLHLRDADGEEFLFPPSSPVPKGDGKWHDIVFQVDVAKPPATHWGKKADGKLTMPMKFLGVIGDFSKAGGTFKIGPMVCDIFESSAPGAVELRTGSGSDIHVLKKGEEKELALSVRNPRSGRLSGTLKWSLTGVRGDALGEKEEKVALETGGEARFPLPEPSAFGVYKLQVEMTDDDPAIRPYQKEMSFAYLIPAGPTKERAEGFVFGIADHPPYYSTADIRKMAMAAGWCGAKALRGDISWALVQPVEGVWNFGFFDRDVKVFGEYGVEMMPIYDFCTPWAVAKDWKPLKPEIRGHQRPDYGHWRKFVGTFAARYRDQVRYTEIWNEPDLYGFANFPENEYVRMLEIAYEEIKKVAPKWQVLTGGFSNVLDKSNKVYNAATIPAVIKSGKYDVFAFHNHTLFEQYVEKLDKLQDYKNRKPLFMTETGLSSMVDGEEIQAQTLFRKFLYTWAKGGIGYTWYNLRNKGFDPKNYEHNFGMLTMDFYPKPVYAAYNSLSNLYRGGKFLNEVKLDDGLYGFLFEGRDGAQLLAAWGATRDGATHPLLVSGITGKAETVDLYGNAKTLPVERGIATFEVGAEPVTLRMTGQSGKIKVAGTLVRPAGELRIVPGEEAVFAFELRNPEKQERNYRVRLTLPEGLSTDAEPEILRFAPEETKQLRFPVRAKADFRSMPGKSKELTLSFGNQKFRYRIDSVTPISANGFRTEPDFVLDSAGQVRAWMPNTPETAHLWWKGEQDLSAKVWLARDGETLLVKAEVRDDRHVQPYSGSDVYNGDNIQLGLIVPKQKVWEFGFTHLESGKSEVHVWIAPQAFQPEEVAAKIALATSRDEKAGLTVYEARIPFSAIGLTKEAARSAIQLNLLVNDNDGSGRESSIAVAPGLPEKDMSRYPFVKF